MSDTRLITRRQAARIIGVKPTTLRRWEQQGRGPALLRLGDFPGAPIRYRMCDVVDWISSRLKDPERQGRPRLVVRGDG